jgi:serine/tyrosine/threonine adenylyltransferase
LKKVEGMPLDSSEPFLSHLFFDNQFTQNLSADQETRNFTRQVQGACFSRVRPKPVAQPHTIAYAREVCEILDISIADAKSPLFAEVFSGNRVLPGMDPFAMCYGGHQFGNWAGQLGDGRAINLGEVVNSRGQRWMLQLKGAGPTPYSRSADGLAVLRSSIREFLCSEAMHHLGIPTTRALCIVGTGELVQRDMFYDGNPQMEPGAIVCRVAPSFTRFGNFQILAARGDSENLTKLVEHTIRTDFPHIEMAQPLTDEVVAQWYREICQRTVEMIVHWMRVGFVHGVMNTDNMSILGLTIDYGPYGWLEDYDPLWTPNTTDASGRRYRFGQQSDVAHWNLWQLANAIVPILGDTEPVQTALNEYADLYRDQWNSMMVSKLGLKQFCDEDRNLIDDLLSVLKSTEIDMTIFFRKLAQFNSETDLSEDKNWLLILSESYYSIPDLVCR